MRRRQKERGVALIMVLLVITLLMILVLEFTYTVQVETHISRNALNSLQATYLARSGINLLAGALVEDKDRQVDPGEEDAWRLYAANGCQTLPPEKPSFWQPGWQLCGRIVDESGKVNVNFSRPSPPAQQQAGQTGQAGQAQDKECKPSQPAASPYCWRDIIAKLTAGRAGVEEEVVRQAIDEYWTSAVPQAKVGQAAQLVAPEFGSLEDVATAVPLLRDRHIFDSVRSVLTAIPVGSSNNKNARRLNFMTAPAPVLEAVLSVAQADEGAVGEIVARRREDTSPKNCGELLQSVTGNKAGLLNLCGLTSNLFRIEASAVANGVGKTVRALVLRTNDGPPVPGTPGERAWRLTYLDWAKESGIGAAVEAANDEGEGLEAENNSANNDN